MPGWGLLFLGLMAAVFFAVAQLGSRGDARPRPRGGPDAAQLGCLIAFIVLVAAGVLIIRANL